MGGWVDPRAGIVSAADVVNAEALSNAGQEDHRCKRGG